MSFNPELDLLKEKERKSVALNGVDIKALRSKFQNLKTKKKLKLLLNQKRKLNRN
jgi:hypothetical protein